ncbi:MAG: DUF2971 domain-containing protein [Bacteroidia bacterium]|jgi:hypothetical protein
MAFTLPGNRIYHYCKLSTAIEHILPNNQLLLSPIKNTNDPRENKSFVFGAQWWQDDFNIGKMNELNQEISNALRDDCKLMCFSEDYKHFWGYESSRMWAHYGDNHKGLCIELDKEEFLKENAGIIDPKLMRKINYYEFNIREPIIHKTVDHTLLKKMGMQEYLREVFRPEHLEYLYFTKNKEWESEQELRLLHFSKNKANEYCSIKKSIRNIFLGVDFHDSYLPAITALCPSIDISKLEYGDVRLIPLEVYKGK